MREKVAKLLRIRPLQKQESASSLDLPHRLTHDTERLAPQYVALAQPAGRKPCRGAYFELVIGFDPLFSERTLTPLH
jgi:hypothetical protein